MKQKKRTRRTATTTAIARVQKLSVADGDVLVLYAKESGLDSLGHITEEIIRLRKFLGDTGRPNCCIIALGPNIKLEHLTPQDMLKLGWAKLHA